MCTLRILNPPMETPNPPHDNPGALKTVGNLTADVPRILRIGKYVIHTCRGVSQMLRIQGSLTNESSIGYPELHLRNYEMDNPSEGGRVPGYR